MYSWDLDSCGHVFFAFNSEKGLEEAYEKIKNIKENAVSEVQTKKMLFLFLSQIEN